MAGYVPLFDSVATGTLYGRWPDIGVWPIVLALADKNGHLDVSPEFLAGVTGLPIPDISACMQRFCEPDPGSRSREESGARLTRLDDARDWGWKIVNHSKYKEKARLMSKDKARTESGQDAERKRKGRRPPKSPGIPLSDSDANTNNKDKALCAPESVQGLDVASWNRWYEYRAGTKKPIKGPSREAAMHELAKFGPNQAAVVQHCIANSYQGLYPPKDLPKNGKKESPWE